MEREERSVPAGPQKIGAEGPLNPPAADDDFDLGDALESTGCFAVLEKLQYCLADFDRDYRKCQSVVDELRKCYANHKLKTKKIENAFCATFIFMTLRVIVSPSNMVIGKLLHRRTKKDRHVREAQQEEPAVRCIRGSEWETSLIDMLNRPDPVVIHTITVPPHFDPTDEELRNAKVVSERVYRLPRGQLPTFAKNPASKFNVHIDPSLIPKDHIIAENITVIDSRPVTVAVHAPVQAEVTAAAN